MSFLGAAESGRIGLSNYELLLTGLDYAIGNNILYLSVASLLISVTLYLGKEFTVSITIILSNKRVLNEVSNYTAASLTPAFVSFYMKLITLSLITLKSDIKSSSFNCSSLKV